jgi:glycosyltransferase involved in cell wall biosynthesis
MRLFQASTVYPAYLRRLNSLALRANTFTERQRIFHADRHGAVHFLKPVLDGVEWAFQSSTNDSLAQRFWATENGMPERATAEEILLAQVEAHKTDVFYSNDPISHPTSFVRRLPGSVKRTVAWRAAPTKGVDFTAYDLVVCNFPSLLEQYRQMGCKVAWFAPAHDPVLNSYAENRDRPIDVLFVGGYTRHHKARAALLEAVAAAKREHDFVFHLDRSRLTRMLDLPLLRSLPLGRSQTPASISRIAKGPIFGLDLYRALSLAKIVLNGAIDMAGRDRGNIRCFEAMGAACVLLSDEGAYPPHLLPGENLITYADSTAAIALIEGVLADPSNAREISMKGHGDVAKWYSKESQFAAFEKLIE